MSRPRIGVTVSRQSGWRVFPFFRLAIWRAGGTAARIEDRHKAHTLDGLDGLVIGGGDDLGVDLYNGRIVADAKVDPGRDAMEKALFTEAEERHLPVLGVCRGAQMINVVRGGNLHQDIYRTFPDARKMRTPLPRKLIRLDPDSRLAAIKGAGDSRVNALHHQSIDRLGENLVAVAWDEAGIVQAIEGTGDRFVVGVQWHPEFLVFSRRDFLIFQALVKAAAEAPANDPFP